MVFIDLIRFLKTSICRFGAIDFKYKFFRRKHQAFVAFLSVLKTRAKKFLVLKKKEQKLLGQKQSGRLPLRPVFKDWKLTKEIFSVERLNNKRVH